VQPADTNVQHHANLRLAVVSTPDAYPHTCREHNHRRASASSTTCKAAGLTPVPTRMRLPCGSSIAMSSVGGVAAGAALILLRRHHDQNKLRRCRTGRYPARPLTPGEHYVCIHAILGTTADTDTPRAEAAVTTSVFSASGHDRCLRLARPFVSIIKFVDPSGPPPCVKADTLPQINPARKAAFTGWVSQISG